MSQYENYATTSQSYDGTRKAVGVEIVLGFLSALDKPLSEISVLDAGCGTANYAEQLRGRVKRFVCADISGGMLGQAQAKLNSSDDMVQCDISQLPFKPNSFDAIMCNQSLHHLDQPDTGYPKQQRFYEFAQKVLKPGGVLIVNTITNDQQRDGVWWADLIKPAVDKMTKRFSTVDELYSMLDNANFKVSDRVVPLDTLIQDVGYDDPNSLRSEAFRHGDSHFALLSETELANALSQLDDIEKSGRWDTYFKEREEKRLKTGQFTFFVARSAA